MERSNKMSLSSMSNYCMSKYGKRDSAMLYKEAIKAQQACFQHVAASKKAAKKIGGKRR